MLGETRPLAASRAAHCTFTQLSTKRPVAGELQNRCAETSDNLARRGDRDLNAAGVVDQVADPLVVETNHRQARAESFADDCAGRVLKAGEGEHVGPVVVMLHLGERDPAEPGDVGLDT